MYSSVTRLEHERGGVGGESGRFPKVDLAVVPLRILSDAHLIDAMLRDAPGAWTGFGRRFDRLIERCITRVTRRFVAIRAQDDVRDVCGSLYLSLLGNGRHKLRSFDPERGNRFSSWIGLLAINCAYDHLRALRREPNRGTMTEAADVASSLPSRFEVALGNERAEIAADLLAGLSERDRAFATFYFGEELGAREIAARMNISVKTVYSKKHKIQTRLARLEEVLAPEGGPIAAASERSGRRLAPDARLCDGLEPRQTLF